MNDIAPVEIENIDITIKLANRDTFPSLRIVRDVEVLSGNFKYPPDFLVLGSPRDDFCPIIFIRTFLNTANAKIDCTTKTGSVNFGDVSHEFHYFSIFHRQNLMIKIKIKIKIRSEDHRCNRHARDTGLLVPTVFDNITSQFFFFAW